MFLTVKHVHSTWLMGSTGFTTELLVNQCWRKREVEREQERKSECGCESGGGWMLTYTVRVLTMAIRLKNKMQ